MNLGIIPVAGNANRWGGIYKEFLPLFNGITLLDQTIHSMYTECDIRDICIITNLTKVSLHTEFLSKYKGISFFYLIQDHIGNIADAIKLVIPFIREKNIMLMPDTYLDNKNLRLGVNNLNTLSIGTFSTTNPERFGTLLEGKIVDKPKELPEGVYEAWGAIMFSNKVNLVDLMLSDFPGFINTNLDGKFNLDFYYDFASISDYKDWLKSEHSNIS